MAKILKPAELAARLAAGEDLAAIASKTLRLVDTGGSAAVEAVDTTRTVRFAISTGGVKRDDMTLAPAGWRIDSYLKNPVVLWAHDDTTPAIGRAIATDLVNGTLMSSAVFAERDVHPLADTVYELIKRGFLNAASVGFCPLKARLSTDPKRLGEIDVLEQELWEWSVVNVPADPEALVAARSVGVDTQPIFEWTERMLDAGGFLVVPKSELEELRRKAKMPARAKPAAKTTEVAAAPVKRSLWHVSDLAALLYSPGYLKARVEDEAAIEGDGSTVPADFASALQALGQVLVAMTVEEVAEFVGNDEEPADVVVGEPVMYAADKPKQRALAVLAAVAGAARAAYGRRFIVRAPMMLTEAGRKTIAAQFAAWRRTPDAELILEAGLDIEVLEPVARAAETKATPTAEDPAPVVAAAMPDLAADVALLKRRLRVLELRLARGYLAAI